MKKTQLPIMIFLLLSINVARGSENNTLAPTKNPKKTSSFFNACIITPLVMGITTYSHTKLNEHILHKHHENQYDLHPKSLSLLTMGVVFAYNFYRWYDPYTEQDLNKNMSSLLNIADEESSKLIDQNKRLYNDRCNLLSFRLDNINTTLLTNLTKVEKLGYETNTNITRCIDRGNEQTNQLNIVSGVMKNNRDNINNINQTIGGCQDLAESIEHKAQNNSTNTQNMIQNVSNMDEMLSGLQNQIAQAITRSNDLLNKKNSK